MKKKIIILLFLAITATSYSQGLYSDEDASTTSLFGDITNKEGTALYVTPGGGSGFGDAGSDSIPIGEGILLLAALAGVYLLIEHITKRTR
jgi:hypothetical protein